MVAIMKHEPTASRTGSWSFVREARYLGAFFLIQVIFVAGCPSSIDTFQKSCTKEADCADESPCTDNTCSEGICVISPKKANEPCSNGSELKCDGTGNCAPCQTDGQCGKDDECVKWSCSDSNCVPVYTERGFKVKEQKDDDCKTNQCDGIGTIEPAPNHEDVQTYQDDCVENKCDAKNEPAHEQSPAGKECKKPDKSDGVCNASGNCVACTDGAGGHFGCKDGKVCHLEQECVNCNNSQKDSYETGTDCGGPDCKPCPDKETCTQPTDCVSNDCENLICISCTDGVQNGDETDIDCGGKNISCVRCEQAKKEKCKEKADCANNLPCVDGYCCNSQCDVACVSCGLDDNHGTCTLAPLGYVDQFPLQSSCTVGHACTGVENTGCNMGQFDASCDSDEQCLSNNCGIVSHKCKKSPDGLPCSTDTDCAGDLSCQKYKCVTPP